MQSMNFPFSGCHCHTMQIYRHGKYLQLARCKHTGTLPGANTLVPCKLQSQQYTHSTGPSSSMCKGYT